MPRPRTLLATLFSVAAAVSVVTALSTLGGALPGPLPLFPADNWWNLDISTAPVDAGSAGFITFIGPTRGMHPDFGGDVSGSSTQVYGFPYAVVDGTAPKRSVLFQYADESDGVDHATNLSFPFYPIPDEATSQVHWIEGGEPGNVDRRSVNDRHLLIIDRDKRHLYELYNVFYDGSQWHAGSGAFFDLNADGRRPVGWTSADAAGLAIFPGLVRYDEVFGSSEIGHAFRVTVRATNGYVFPGSHRAGSTAGALPMGARLRLKPRDLSGFTPEVQKIFRAMQRYGLIVADNGSDMYVSGTYDTRWNNGVLNPAFSALKAGDFDVISLGLQPPPQTRVMTLTGNLALGNVRVGTLAQTMLTITNSGSGTMAVSSISYPTGFSGNWTSGTIAPGGSRLVTVTFAPLALTAYGGMLTVNGDQTSGTNRVTVSGAGVRFVSSGDFDGEGKADPTVYRPSTGGWYSLSSSTNYTSSTTRLWGLSTDTVVPGDYDGDGKIDPAVFRSSTGNWHVLKSSTNYTTSQSFSWGLSTDTPVPGDYDGDGKTDPAVFRSSTGWWYFLKSSTNYTTSAAAAWGLSTDKPMQADYDGDGKTDPAVFRPTTGAWYFLKSSTNYTTSAGVSWGLSADVPVPGDYDGDGKSDPAVYRQSTGNWHVLKSSTNYTTSAAYSWGLASDVPVPGDYDGDGKIDPAIFRPSTGVWAILRSSANYSTSIVLTWGLSTDVPILKRP